jgi:uncharacterized protein
MKWLDRENELGRLVRLAERADGGLAILWGRRRVGKTRLLVEWTQRVGGVYFVADESAPAVQRRRFASALDHHLPGFGDVEYPDWARLLERLARDAAKMGLRGPFVIDELPYLVAASPDLPAILQRFVDHDARRARLILAFAGSSQRMMQGLVLSADAPLYGRAREAFAVEPLPPAFLAQALRLRTARAAVEAWSTWGGSPRYWELAADYEDPREAVDDLVLRPSGVLHEEPSRLLMEELPPATSLRPVLDVIGAGAHRLSEIAGRLATPSTSLARPMARLAELGLVVRETPFGVPARSTKRALYRLADPFIRMWFQVVAPKRALLTHAPKAARVALFDARASQLASASWEELCRAAVPRLGDRLGHELGPAQRFWGGSGPEWDLAAGGLREPIVLVGEVKWLAAPATAEALQAAHAELLKKGEPPFARGETIHAIFVPELPRRRPAGLPPSLRLIDARMVLDALSSVD